MPIPEESPNKAAFLQRVREALGRTEPLLHTPDHPPLKIALPRQEEKVRTVTAKVEVRRPINIERLMTTAAEASWRIQRLRSYEDAKEAVVKIARQANAKVVARTAEDIFRRVDIDEPLRRARINPSVMASGRSRRKADLKGAAFQADVGVSGVKYAIAETGSCVLVPGKGISRLASIAPPIFIALVEASQVLESMDDFFAFTRLDHQRTRTRIAPYFTFVSGPSRTADIEQTLTIGVHGPGEVHMLLIG